MSIAPRPPRPIQVKPVFTLLPAPPVSWAGGEEVAVITMVPIVLEDGSGGLSASVDVDVDIHVAISVRVR
jgi:hypothetical protein